MNKMSFRYPVQGRYSIGNGYSDHVAIAEREGLCSEPFPAASCPKGYYYGGIDFFTTPPIGAPIIASADGPVAQIYDQSGGYGKGVKLSHSGGYQTVYGHMSRVLCKAGQAMKAGDVIGETGWSGNVWDGNGQRSPSAAHLHLELRLNGRAIDPMPLLVAGTVEVDGGLPPVTAPPTPSFALPDVPAKLKSIAYKTSSLITSAIRIRVNPIDGMMIDWLKPGEIINVISWVSHGNDYWFLGSKNDLKFGWVAALYNGEVWLVPA